MKSRTSLAATMAIAAVVTLGMGSAAVAGGAVRAMPRVETPWADSATLPWVGLPWCAHDLSPRGPEPPAPALRVGLPWPQRDATELQLRALDLAPGQVTLCREDWSTLLPDLVPWTPSGTPVHHYGYAVFAIALLAWALLLAAAAPRRGCPPLTLTGLLTLKLGGLLLAMTLLRVVNASGWPQQHVYGHVLSWQRGDGPVHWVEIGDLRGFRATFQDVAPALALAPLPALAPPPRTVAPAPVLPVAALRPSAGTGTPRHHAGRRASATICLPARGAP